MSADPWPADPYVAASTEFEPVVECRLPWQPVSAHSATKARRAVGDAVRSLTRTVPWVFSADVSVDIEWTVPPRYREQNGSAVDVDNIIKPVIDGLTGPDGCLIDDNQIQEVSAHWLTWMRPNGHYLRVRINSLDPDGYLPKPFVMVRIRDQRCVPLPHLDRAPRELLARWYVDAFATDDALSHLGERFASNPFAQSAREFHRSRLKGFEVVTPDEYIAGRYSHESSPQGVEVEP